MNCSEFQLWLQRYLDGEVEGDPGSQGHLAVCSSCRELQRAAQQLMESLRAQVAPSPSEGFQDRIVTAVMADLAASRLARQRRRRVLATAAIAAGLLLAVALGLSWWRSTQNVVIPTSGPLVKDEKKPFTPSAPSPLNIEEAGTALVALVNRTADETVGQGRTLLPPEVPAPRLPPASAWQQPLSQAPDSLQEVQQSVAVGFEPVTSSARRAVSLFLDEIPPMQAPKQ
jgi:hypothetical protein